MIASLSSKRRGGRGRLRERGVLLVDAMVAIMFLAIGLATWASMTNVKLRTIGEADRRFRATLAAESAIAEVREGVRAEGAFEVKGGSGLKGTTRFLPRPDGLTEIVVEVRWREPGSNGSEEAVVISTAGRT